MIRRLSIFAQNHKASCDSSTLFAGAIWDFGVLSLALGKSPAAGESA
jgi:hypothetical protein